MSQLVPDLNNALENMVHTLEGLASDQDREAGDRIAAKARYTDYGASPEHVRAMPGPEGPRLAAAFYRHAASEAKAGRVYIATDPPDGVPPIHVSVPNWYNVQTQAVLANRVTYERASDPWKFSDVNTPRDVEAPTRPLPITNPWPGPTSGAQG